MRKGSLNAKEKDLLQECEAAIGRHERGFLEAGRALGAIMGKRLYRAEYRDFESYASERWDMSRGRSYQLIEAARVVDDLSTIVDISVLPINEAQARPLTPLGSQQRREVWLRVLEAAGDGPVTAALVSGMVDRHLEETTGITRRPESVRDVFARISEMKKKLRKMESKPEYARFCKEMEGKLAALADQVETAYETAMRDYLQSKAA